MVERGEFEPSVPVVNVAITGGNTNADASSEAIAKESSGRRRGGLQERRIDLRARRSVAVLRAGSRGPVLLCWIGTLLNSCTKTVTLGAQLHERRATVLRVSCFFADFVCELLRGDQHRAISALDTDKYVWRTGGSLCGFIGAPAWQRPIARHAV